MGCKNVFLFYCVFFMDGFKDCFVFGKCLVGDVNIVKYIVILCVFMCDDLSDVISVDDENVFF